MTKSLTSVDYDTFVITWPLPKERQKKKFPVLKDPII